MDSENRISKPKLERIGLARELMTSFRARLDEQLQPLGITTAQLRVLWAVELHPGASGAEISRTCGVTPQSGQALLARLEAEGRLRRHAGETSERVRVAEVTAKGRRLLEKARHLAEALDAELWQGVGQKELATVDAILRQAVARLGS